MLSIPPVLLNKRYVRLDPILYSFLLSRNFVLFGSADGRSVPAGVLYKL